jgi:hypothetical protein
MHQYEAVGFKGLARSTHSRPVQQACGRPGSRGLISADKLDPSNVCKDKQQTSWAGRLAF